MNFSDHLPGPPRRDDDHVRLLMDNVRDYAIFTTDRGGLVSSWNAGSERTLGYAEDEVIGRPLSIFYTPEDVRDGVPEAELRTALATGRALNERWHARKDGTRVWCSGIVSPLFDETGLHRGFGKVMRDLTERKLLEGELEASEARFRSIAEQSPVLTWRSDAEGKYDYFNRPWYEFRGETPEHEIGRGLGWTEGIHPEDRERYVSTYLDAFADRRPFECTFRLRRHDGRYRWVIDRGVPYQDPQGKFLGYLGSCMDITERVELEAELGRQRELAEEASRHKTRLLSALSHDARTPLNAVVLSARLLEMYLKDRDDPEIELNLRTIRNSVKNVLDLLGDLLDLARIDAGVLPAVVSRFSLEAVLTECLSGIEPQARAKGIEVRLEPGDLAGAALETDRTKLKQVLSNLLSNSLRYTESGHIALRAGRAAGEVRLAVEDTGTGIEPDDQKRVFDEFVTLDKPHRPIGEGTGLGLAICLRLASLLGGEITLKSEPGRGSTFTLALPETVLSGEGPGPEPQAPPADRDARPGAILVAEDHLASRQAMAKVLRRMGFAALEASNGREALESARRERPLAILMDINMPVMDGIDATLALRADPATRDVPIFALTGDVTLMNQRRIGDAGVDGFLEKPVSWDALEKALASIGGPGR